MNSRRLRRGLAPPRRGELRSRRLDDTGFRSPVEEVNEVFANLHRNRGVVGVIATLSDGAVIKSTLPDREMTNRYAMMAVGLCSEARNTPATGHRDRPIYINVTNENHEIIITPGRTYTLILSTAVLIAVVPSYYPYCNRALPGRRYVSTQTPALEAYKSTLPDREMTNRYAMMAVGLCSEARNTPATGHRDRPIYINVTNENHEIIITPGRTYTLILVKQLHETPEEDS
ncbi:hypothetical protein MTO96_011679 [Rhipicephalus appendiculatus]